MKSMDYPLKYMGHTSQTFYTRYKQHMQAIMNNNDNSGYSNHILNTGHAYRSMTDTMKIIKMEKKEKHLSTLERYHMYKVSKNRLHMNDTYIGVCNPIFETLQELNTI
jgi:hypothetical protein